MVINRTSKMTGFHLQKKRAWRVQTLQALEVENCVFLEPVHEAEPEPAGVCQARDPAPISNIHVCHIGCIEGV
jgi:hypothetical protein